MLTSGQCLRKCEVPVPCSVVTALVVCDISFDFLHGHTTIFLLLQPQLLIVGRLFKMFLEISTSSRIVMTHFRHVGCYTTS